MIRRAIREDVAELAILEIDCFGTGAWSQDLLAGDVARDSYRVLVSTDGEKLIGYGAISVAADVADLQRLAVCAPARRAGEARLLLVELLTASVELGAERILLEVAEGNVAAVKLYESSGFSRVGKRTNYYSDGSAALVFERSLR